MIYQYYQQSKLISIYKIDKWIGHWNVFDILSLWQKLAP